MVAALVTSVLRISMPGGKCMLQELTIVMVVTFVLSVSMPGGVPILWLEKVYTILGEKQGG